MDNPQLAKTGPANAIRLLLWLHSLSFISLVFYGFFHLLNIFGSLLAIIGASCITALSFLLARMYGQSIGESRRRLSALLPLLLLLTALGVFNAMLTILEKRAVAHVVENPFQLLRYLFEHISEPKSWFYFAISFSFDFILIYLFSLEARSQRAWEGKSSPSSQDPFEGAAAMAASDAPLDSWRQDRLQFTPLARGISRFLRHQMTTPPLTIAVTGDWGSGKSTLMKLICEDLKRCGWRAVWFNAWHHQTEEQLLPGLLDAIRRKGVPGPLSLQSPAFRLKLLWIRSKSHFALAITLLLAFVAAAGFLYANHDPASIAALTGLLGVPSDAKSGANVSVGLGQIAAWAALLTALVALFKWLKPFGLNPAVLLVGVLDNARLKDMNAHIGFRARFAREFDEVTRALPEPLVIVIDDLDRCQSKAILQIMEAVNFLTTSGNCYVIFGMASRRVLAALALSFNDIAKELVELDGAPPIHGTGAGVDEGDERQRRQRYARDYLEKLINLEILVPDRSDLHPADLLKSVSDDNPIDIDDQGSATPIVLRRIGEQLRRRLLPILGMTLLLLAVWATWHTMSRLRLALPNSTALSTAAPTSLPTAQPHSSIEGRGVAGTPVTSAAQSSSSLALASADSSNRSSAAVLFSAVIAILLAGLAYVVYLRPTVMLVHDSKAFKAALRIWAPIACYERKSPRFIKRFGNRVRYLCMLQQDAWTDGSSLSRSQRIIAAMLMMITGRTHNTPASAFAELSHEMALKEHQVVALGAIYELFGENWRTRIDPDCWNLEKIPASAELAGDYKKAIKVYTDMTATSWPPTDDEIAAFQRTLKGVRLP